MTINEILTIAVDAGLGATALVAAQAARKLALEVRELVITMGKSISELGNRVGHLEKVTSVKVTTVTTEIKKEEAADASTQGPV